MLLGYERLNEGAVGTHKDCRLGKWCIGCDKSDGRVATIIDGMERPHAKLHDLAKKAIREYNSGHIDMAEETLKDMDVVSKEVVSHLAKLKKVYK